MTNIRLRSAYGLRLWPAIVSSAIAAAVFLIAYYVLFYFVPSPLGDGPVGWPHAPWAGQFDLCQLWGTMLDPPYPTSQTFFLGIALTLAGLTGQGAGYCLLLAWAMRPTSIPYEIGFGVVVYCLTGFVVWTLMGVHPAVMRDAMPDPGFFLLGWSGWASFALLLCCCVFALCVGRLYAVFGRTGSPVSVT